MQLLPELLNSCRILRESSEDLKREEFFGDLNIIGSPILNWNLPLQSSNADFADWPYVVFCYWLKKQTYTLFLSLSAAKSLQSCPTLCDPIDGSPPGSPVPGILQARTLQWVAISFSNARKWKVKVKSLSCVRLLATPWTAAHQAPPSMGFSRQEYWSGVPLPSLQR